jgi:hypothetical protein
MKMESGESMKHPWWPTWMRGSENEKSPNQRSFPGNNKGSPIPKGALKKGTTGLTISSIPRPDANWLLAKEVASRLDIPKTHVYRIRALTRAIGVDGTTRFQPNSVDAYKLVQKRLTRKAKRNGANGGLSTSPIFSALKANTNELATPISPFRNAMPTTEPYLSLFDTWDDFQQAKPITFAVEGVLQGMASLCWERFQVTGKPS